MLGFIKELENTSDDAKTIKPSDQKIHRIRNPLKIMITIGSQRRQGSGNKKDKD